jgi:hypothetical protein
MLGIAALALGVAGLCMLLPMLIFPLCGIIPFGLGVAGTLVGILGISRARKDPSRYIDKVVAIIGTTLGLLCILAPILWTAIVMGLYLYLGMEKPSGRFY